MFHPKYGGGFIASGYRPIPRYDGYSINEQCRVRGKQGTILSHGPNYQVNLWMNGNIKKERVYRLALKAFFPHIKELETVDHIDGNHRNNHICNLQWMTRRDNTRKSQLGVPSGSGAAQSKAVWLLDGREGERVTRYASTVEAATSLGNTTAKCVSGSALSGGRLASHGYFFVYDEQPDLLGEVWTTSEVLDRELNQTDKPDHKKVKVSNYGRIRTTNGIKKRGAIDRRVAGNKYRVSGANFRLYKDHQLVFMGWYNREAPTQGTVDADGNTIVICHDDTAPRDAFGCYRNWPCDLSLGTMSKNLRDAHEERRRRKRAREEEEDDVAEIENDAVHSTVRASECTMLVVMAAQ